MLKRHPIYRFLYINKVLKSGNDIALVKVKTLKEAKKIINKYKKMYNIDHLNNSVKRILKVKEKYSINDRIENIGMNLIDINYLIDNINNKIEEIK